MINSLSSVGSRIWNTLKLKCGYRSIPIKISPGKGISDTKHTLGRTNNLSSTKNLMTASVSTGKQEPDTPLNCSEEQLPLILSFEIIPAFTIVHSEPVSIKHSHSTPMTIKQ